MKTIVKGSLLSAAALVLGASVAHGQGKDGGKGKAPAAPQPMSFFVTSVGVGKGGDLGGLAGADMHCQMLAAAAGRGNAIWHAYLRGQLFCLDARTGKTLWTGPPRNGDNAALLVSSASLIELKNEGELVVAKPRAKSFEVVHRYTVADSETWAHPLVLADGVLIQDANSLARWAVE